MTHILPPAEIIDNKLHFSNKDGFNQACQFGAFYLKHPDRLNFNAGITLAKNYYLEPNGELTDDYRGYRTKDLRKSLLGYSQTGNDQDELLQIECALWHEYLPETVSNLLWAINDISRITLSELFIMAGVYPDDIDTITGGMYKNNALQYCIFNHFRSHIQYPVGLTAHKDSGFITTLYTTEPGLESLEGDKWLPFDPLDGYFTVVIGHSFEILMSKSSQPVTASYHRVRGMKARQSSQEDRFTFGTYIGPRWDQDLYQYDNNGILTPIESFLDFQKRKADEMAYEFHPKVENIHK
ncbi:2OG-Fe(II) oxygenase family protein [Photorhabdus heterorhabditis]|uniref:2OG-Fe(II) oxygenase family protein n=1 Tax=Photorhabdus heterorhabditis TaxID=880156 RepID=UPI00156258B3|nr:2OG-Fe(II) oxygenase family protein [Photorhabdus heterorhabditis]NRN30782.1 isopenicillin N synthase family oxygenase [Photorhabdus heterorhabditis subsp. aluminescens]